jgi:RHS repeat-associated protein
VATQSNASGVATIDSYAESDEYGNPVPGSPQLERYGWLGSHQRSKDTVGQMMLMGARVYNPKTGAFQSQDPVWGGNYTRYTYPSDPINSVDLDGHAGRTYWWGGWRYYSVWGPNYTRIWLNKAMMRSIARISTYTSRMSAGLGFVFTALSAMAGVGIITAPAAPVSAAVSVVWYAIAGLFKGAASTLRWLADRNRCLAYKLYTVKKVPVGGYPYLSSYACSVGG